MTIDSIKIGNLKHPAKEYAYGITTKDYIGMKEFRIQHYSPPNRITYSIYPPKYLLDRLEVGPGKIEEGYIIVQAFSTSPINEIPLILVTPHGEFPYTVKLTKVNLLGFN
jgi:hypothetical protein